jgi:hypothetical protein
MEATTVLTVPRKVARGAMVLLFWVAAALLVFAAHQLLDRISSVAAATVKVMAIVGVAFAYMRLTARETTLDHALFVGIAWLLFDIVAELATTSMVGRGWYQLIGSPAKASLRDLLMVTWITAPAIFARYRS